jgi:hypothetical protein
MIKYIEILFSDPLSRAKRVGAFSSVAAIAFDEIVN